MDGPSDDGSDRDDSGDAFDYDPFDRDEGDAGDGPDRSDVDDEWSRVAADAGRGSETSVADADGEPGHHGTDDGSDGLLGGGWGPRGEGVTVGSRLWAVGVAVGLGVAGFAVAFFVFQIASVVLFLAGVSLQTLSFVGNLIVGFLVLQGVSFPLVALAYLRYRGLSLSYLRLQVPDLWDVAWVVGGFVLVFVLVMAVLVAISVSGAPQAERTDTQEFRENPNAILLMIPISVLVIGPAEELLFRGVIQTRLREAFGPVGAVVFANFAFAPLHVFALSGSAAAVAVTIGGLFVPGLVFGTTYELTDNLAVPALIHGLYNAMIFTTFYLSATAILV